MADLQQLVAQQRQLEEELDIQHMVAEQKRLEEDKVDTNPSGCDTPTIAKVVMATPNRGPVFVLDSTYKAVNKYKLADSTAPNLLGGAALPLPPCGSLFPEDDGRHILAFSEFNFSKKLNIMCSFDRKSMKCRCCPSPVLVPMNSSCKSERRTLVLCDQNFPAVLPAGGDKQCIKILRVENGSLWEIFGVYAEMLREQNYAVPVGSAILMASTSHLVRVGLSAYAEELVAVSRRILSLHNGAVYFLPCPVLLMEGTNDPEVVRMCLELISWLGNALQKEVNFTPNAMGALVNAYIDNDKTVRAVNTRRLLLPTSMSNTVKRSWASGEVILPASADPLSTEEEGTIIKALIGDLNQRLDMDLDPCPSLARVVEVVPEPIKSESFVVVGASHAGRTTQALKQTGYKAMLVTVPGWRAIKIKAPAMEAVLKEALQDMEPNCTVVFQMLDSAFYYARTDEGSLLPGVRDPVTGRYHMHGELVLGPKEMQFATFTDMKNIFEAAGTRPKIIVSPVPRFLSKPCCDSVDHMPNFREEDFRTKMLEAVQECRRNLKDFGFRLGLRNFRVVSPWSCVQHIGDGLWADDGVHLKEEGYRATAAQLVLVNSEMAGRSDQSNKRGRECDDFPQPPTTRQRRGGYNGFGGLSGRGGGRGRGLSFF